MCTTIRKTLFLTFGILLFEVIDSFANDLNQPANHPHFGPTTNIWPVLQPAITEGTNQAIATTYDYSTVTYDRTKTSRETSIKSQPPLVTSLAKAFTGVVYPNSPTESETTPVLSTITSPTITKRGTEITYYPANITTVTTTVNTSDSITVVDVETSPKPVTATTVVVTPDSETVATVESSPELGAAISLAEAEKCPPTQSLISEKDIELLVKLQVQNLDLATALNESFFTEIISLKENIEKDLRKFLFWFEERPAHLKHILEYLRHIRENLQKVLSQKKAEFQEFYTLENDYNIKLERVEKVTKKIEKYKNICKYNCEDEGKIPNTRRVYQEPSFVEKRESNTTSPTDISKVETSESDGEHYCSKIDDLVLRIENLLLHHFENSIQEFKDRIANDSKMYEAQVEELKTVLKSKALAQFGPTMYDILNLHDQYYHFDQGLQVNVQSHIHFIKTRFSNLEASVTNLEYQSEKLRKYCSTCHSSSMMLRRRYARAADDSENALFEGDSNSNKDLVENVTLRVYTDYKNRVMADYQYIFNGLDMFIASSKDEEIFNVKNIQEDITKMSEEEAAELNKLKESLPENPIDKIVDLESKTVSLNERIVMLSNELKEKYGIYSIGY